MLFPLEWAAEPLSAALTLASRAQALIIDLRANRGGDPDTVAFVCSYLLDERTHLNSMYWRADDRTEQSWSLPHVPGTRFGGTKPLYVLSSADTFSAAEELAYDLQQLGRAIVVGERTRGGAHPCEGWTVHPTWKPRSRSAAPSIPSPARTGRAPAYNRTSRAPRPTPSPRPTRLPWPNWQADPVLRLDGAPDRIATP